MQRENWLGLSYLVVLSFAASGLRGVEVVTNLSEPWPNTHRIVDTNNFRAISFTTDSKTYILSEVALDMTIRHSAGSTFQLMIYDSNGADPGVPATNGLLSGSVNPGQLEVYTSIGTINPEPNTTYWVVAASNNGRYRWKTTPSLDESGSFTIGNDLKTSSSQGTSPWTTHSSEAFLFRVNATEVVVEPVPTLTEWGIFALILLLAGAAFLHVRKLQLASVDYR